MMFNKDNNRVKQKHLGYQSPKRDISDGQNLVSRPAGAKAPNAGLSSSATDNRSEEPHIGKEQEDGEEEKQPHAPADACPFGHTQHPVHRASKPYSGAVKSLVQRIC